MNSGETMVKKDGKNLIGLSCCCLQFNLYGKMVFSAICVMVMVRFCYGIRGRVNV